MQNVCMECVSVILYAFIVWKGCTKLALVCTAVIENHPPYMLIMLVPVQYMNLAYT
jgi:hypothetical protein